MTAKLWTPDAQERNWWYHIEDVQPDQRFKRKLELIKEDRRHYRFGVPKVAGMVGIYQRHPEPARTPRVPCPGCCSGEPLEVHHGN